MSIKYKYIKNELSFNFYLSEFVVGCGTEIYREIQNTSMMATKS